MAREKPYLVQRLKLNTYHPGDRKGVDRYFSFDYMGSAEFEFGALPSALKSMRAHPTLPEWKPTELTHKSHCLWFLGPKDLEPVALELFKSRFHDRYESDLKERTYIFESLTGKDRNGEDRQYLVNIVGWWCIDTDLGFALFKDKDHAKWFLTGLRQPPRQ